jgi:NADH:ubiquinone oxidoreductase subunit 5 (subunit L)/multisubunit Na+/H+ antiporter MnhA subunit
MNRLIELFIILPLIGFVISLVLPARREHLISQVAFGTAGLHMVMFQFFFCYWVFHGMPVLQVRELSLYHSDNYEFVLYFYFDKVTAAYLFVGSILTFMVTLYSGYYLHREQGYKRFFNTILFFYLGYNLILFSGNLETLFVGWEALGISSFLLIAFYRDRYLPVKNAVKVYSIYRLGDVGLLLAMWLSHHLFKESITFSKLSNYELVHEHLQVHSWVGIFISVMFLVAAAAKSAQFPFSTWLPRAMEGPTPSSAIFYGSLSVHMGVFLLLRTFPFWEHQLSVRILIALLGLITSMLATSVARVQSSIKSQVAYSSIAQIGLIFVEIALGWHYLALLHFAGNAFLRTYQLLVSPSVVSYQIREQFYHFVPRQHTLEDSLPKRLEYSLYVLSLREWNLDNILYHYLWRPVKWVGNRLNFLETKNVMYYLLPLFIAGMALSYAQVFLPAVLREGAVVFFLLLALIMVIKAFTERIHARMSWILVVFTHFFVALGLSFNESVGGEEILMYLSGIGVFGVVGFVTLTRLKRIEGGVDLERFHGHAYRHPRFALVFLLSALAVTGFPITSSFIGEDLMFNHIHESQVMVAVLTSLNFIIDGLATIRIYSRVFLGPHSKSVYEMAYRSS